MVADPAEKAALVLSRRVIDSRTYIKVNRIKKFIGVATINIPYIKAVGLVTFTRDKEFVRRRACFPWKGGDR